MIFYKVVRFAKHVILFIFLFFIIVPITYFSFLYQSAYVNTIYAPGFSAKNFNSIRVGDSIGRVEKILGKPLSISPPNSGTPASGPCEYSYSALQSVNGHCDMWIYRIQFNANGRASLVEGRLSPD
jgi:hypothetical protein